MLGESLIQRIGNTPLLNLGKTESGAEILAKAEWNNPGGSVKDRAAWAMLEAAERSGAMNAARTLLEATSGNTGIALAMLCAARGYKIRLCLPENISPERRRILKAYGAEITYTDPGESSDGAIRKAREIIAAEPEKYCYTDQYSNPANWQAHYRTTAEEIWRQTEGRVTHFCATMGTSGTFIGTARRLKELNPAIRCVSLQPDAAFHGLEGLKHMASAMVPEIYDATVADEDMGIDTEAAYAAVRYLARKRGLLVGISAGAAWVGANAIARQAGPGAVVVTVFPDNADKYLSERFWEVED